MSLQHFDRLTQELGRATSRRAALRVLAGMLGSGVLVALGTGCSGAAPSVPDPCSDEATPCGDDCCTPTEACVDGACQPIAVDACAVASACGARQYCNEEQTCICVQSAEGVNVCGQLPDSCYMPLCTTSADCAYLGAGYFCDTPHSGCCSDPPAELQRCIAPCGSPPCPDEFRCNGMCCAENESCVGGACCTPENICGSMCCGDGETCVDGACTVDMTPSLIVNSSPGEDGLLFVAEQPTDRVYFHGEIVTDSLAVSLVALEDEYGVLDALIVDEDFLPIQWMLDDVTIQARRQSGETTFDPSNALHIVLETEGESSTQIDIRPDRLPLDELLDQLEAEDGETFEEARAFLSAEAASWAELVAKARTAGEDQAAYLHAAIAFSSLSAALALPGAATSSAISPSFSTGIARGLAKSVTKRMLKKIKRDFKDSRKKQDRTAPSIYVLRCRGASAIPNVCHNAYFVYRGSAFPCLDVCHTTLACFTDICQPEYMSLDDVDGYRAGH